MSKKTETEKQEAVEAAVESEKQETVEPAVDLEQSAVVMPAEGLNLRSRPTYDAMIIKEIPEGTVIQMLALPVAAEGWRPVFDGVDLGWVREEFLANLAPEV